MDFELSIEQSQLVKSVRPFLKKEIAPVIAPYQKSGEIFPKDLVVNVFKKLIPFGYVSGVVPEDGGGGGLGFSTYGLLLEELAKISASLALAEIGQSLVTRYTLYKQGSDYLKSKYLPGMIEGDIMGAAALTEPDVGSGARDITTSAILKGEEYVINGTKCWSTGGEIADVIFVVAVRNPEKGKPKDYCTFLVDTRQSKISSSVYHKLGTRGVGSAEIAFEDCRVPQNHIIGEPGKGLDATLESIGLGRLANATIALGIAESALEKSIEYANQRKQFGKLIGKFQLIQEMIADMAVDADICRLLGYRVLSMIDRGVRCDKEASMAKFYSVEACVRVTSMAIQIHGAIGLSEELPVERYFRDARTWAIPDGTTQIQTLIVGRLLLGISAIR